MSRGLLIYKEESKIEGIKNCYDCQKEFIRPFDNGDDKIRCESCAVLKYLSLPYVTAQLAIKWKSMLPHS